MGLLDPALLAYLKRPDAIWFPLLEIDASDGTTLRYTGKDAAIASKSLGLYEGRVEQWGSIGRSVSGREGSLVAPTASITLDDRDRAVTRKAPYILRQTARIKIAVHESAGLAATTFFTYFTGKVYAYEQGPETWRLDLRQDDIALDGDIPKRRLTVWDWPNIDRRNIGKPVPIIYGRQERTGFAGDRPGGMVPAYRVDGVGFVYVLAGHFCKAVPKVYAADVLKTVATDYTITNPVRNGNQYTCIDFVLDPGEDVAITADVDGIEDVGTGAGTLISTPTDEYAHFLTNWVWGDYRAGAYAATDSRIDATYLASALAFGNAYSYAGSRWIGELKTGLSWLDEWASSWEAMQFWTNAGKLCPSFFDHRNQNDGIHVTTGWIRWDEHRQGDTMSLTPDDQAYQSNLRIEHAYSAAEGQYFETHVTQDASATDRGLISRQAPWLPNYGGVAYGDTFNNIARTVGGRRINRYRNPIGRLKARCPIYQIDNELLTVGPVSWDRGMIPGGVGWGLQPWERQLFMLTETSINLDTGEVDVSLEALRPALASFHHSGRSRTTVASGAEDGLFVVDVGTARTMTRASKKWSDDPGGYVAEQAAGTLPVTKNGLMIEDAITNELLESSFASSSGSVQFLSPDATDSSTGTVTAFGIPTPASLWEAVDDPNLSPDGYASYIYYTLSATAGVRFTFTNLVGTPIISSLKLRTQWDAGDTGAGAATIIPHVKIGGVTYDGAGQATTGNGFSEYSYTWAVSPATGIAWTVAEVNAIIAGWRVDTVPKTNAAQTQVVIEVACVSSAVLYNQGGGGQGTVTFTTDDYLFQDVNGAAVTSAKIFATSPAQGTNMGLSVDTASLAANSQLRVSIDYKNTTGGTLFWRLQRLVDNFTWNDTTHVWGAAVVNNALSVSTAWRRALVGGPSPDTPSAPIALGAGASVVRLFLLQIAGSTNNNQIDRVGHMQIERAAAASPEPWWSSRKISNGGAAFAGAADVLSWPNDGSSGFKIVPVKRGTMKATVIPNFDVRTGPAGPVRTFVVWSIVYSAPHGFLLTYSDGGTGTWGWRLIVGNGGVATAFVADTNMHPGQAREVWCRWTSSVGDLGLAAGTASIFVRAPGGAVTKGTDATFGASPTEAAATFYLGSNAGASQWNGEIRDIRFMPWTLTDGEIGYDQPS